MGYLLGDCGDGEAAVVGLDEEAVQRGGLQGGRVEAGTVGEIAARIEQGARYMGVAPHAVDDECDLVECGLAAGVENVLSGPHVMNNNGFAELVRQLQVMDENRCLDVEG